MHVYAEHELEVIVDGHKIENAQLDSATKSLAQQGEMSCQVHALHNCIIDLQLNDSAALASEAQNFDQMYHELMKAPDFVFQRLHYQEYIDGKINPLGYRAVAVYPFTDRSLYGEALQAGKTMLLHFRSDEQSGKAAGHEIFVKGYIRTEDGTEYLIVWDSNHPSPGLLNLASINPLWDSYTIEKLDK